MRQEKQLLLDEIQGSLDSSHAFIVARYQQLQAQTMSDFRRAVVKSGGRFQVVRKRVFLKAAESIGVTLSKEALDGHIGVLYTTKDPVEMTKAVFDFSKENADAVQVLAGHFDGKLYNASDVEKLSKLPGINEMRAQFLGLLEAPMAQTLGVMDALLTSVLHCLENKCQKESEQQ
ncbi:MAG: rplJ [Chlamydiales bacterium]|jgi:large subunit ribosomal protein L10|nr:rplJ [Chlamydiales bacterium]